MAIGLTIFFAALGAIVGGRAGWAKGIIYGWAILLFVLWLGVNG